MSTTPTLESLRNQHCKPRRGKDAGLDPTAVSEYAALLPGWSVGDDEIIKDYRFADHFHTMAFVNAVASVSHREDHHPDLEVGYGHCKVRYSTHDVGGLSLNDFICAAKIEDLLVK